MNMLKWLRERFTSLARLSFAGPPDEEGGGSSGRRLAAAWEYLTAIPAVWAPDYRREDIAGSLPWLPVVGLALGLVAAILALVADWLLPGAVAATLGLLLLVKLTGAQGLQAVAGLANEVWQPQLRARSGSPLAGAKLLSGGAILAVSCLILKIALLADLTPWQRARALLLLPAAGHAAMVFATMLVDYVGRDDDLEAVLWQGRSQTAVMVAMGIWLAVALTLGAAGLFALVFAVVYATAFVLFCRRRLGGLHAEAFVALGELGELVTLLILAIACPVPSGW